MFLKYKLVLVKLINTLKTIINIKKASNNLLTVLR